MKCIVLDVLEAWDMRRKAELRADRRVRRLQPGQCVIAINSRCTIAQVAICGGGIIEWRAGEREYLDVASIHDLMDYGLKIVLDASTIDQPLAA